ncbi:sialate O-acetylesterase [Wenyingzhuangia sp. 2_MG-2023]|nr:sialate O-acetylesterase [Wenyingzhuangia sp. 2_MG-2023]MDO6738211.1 sialate O-acetylesterase [Wenyingzhuangia sp. 2_MG-2023]
MNSKYKKLIIRNISCILISFTSISISSQNTALPTDFKDLVLWLDAEDVDGDNITEGLSEDGLSESKVTIWKDKSGENNDVTGTALPTLLENQLNNKPTVDFSGYKYLATSNQGQITANGSYTKLAVFTYNTATGSNHIISSENLGTVFWGATTNKVNAWHIGGGSNNPGYMTSDAANDFTTSYHIAVIRYDNIANDSQLSIINIDGTQQADTDNTVQTHQAKAITIGGHNGGASLDGNIAEVLVFNRGLSDTEIDCMEAYLSSKWGIAVSSVANSCIEESTISLTKTAYPQYKIFQRDHSDQYDFTLSGSYTGDITTVEASFNGSDYTVIDADPNDGTWSGTLSNQGIGQGRISVRFSNNTAIEDGVDDIGIGDIYVVAGQSNAEGYALAKQYYTSVAPTATVFPTVYTQGDVWNIGNDSTDPHGDLGSAWPILGGYIAENTGIPVCFITTASGGTSLVSTETVTGNWQRGESVYNIMTNQVTEANPNNIKAVLWFQGEKDSSNGISRADYNAGLDQLLIDIHTDLPGSPDLIPGVIGPWIPAEVNSTQIRLGIIDAWNDNENILHGPQMYDIKISNDGIGDNLHFKSDDEIQTLGFRWWKALEEHYYSGTTGRGPIVYNAELLSNETEIVLTFITSSSLLPASDLATDIWFVYDNGTEIPVNSAVVSATDKVTLTLAQAPTSSILTVTYAKDNTAEGKAVLTDSTTGNTAEGVSHLPADVFSDFSVVTPSISLASIIAYADDNINNEPTVNDYSYIGVTGVDENNVALVNSKIEALDGTQVNTVFKIQEVVDSASLKIDNVDLTKVKLYPNPSSEMVSINLEIKNIVLYNATGQKVFTTNANTFDISQLSNGTYFIEITTIDGAKTTKSFIKK